MVLEYGIIKGKNQLEVKKLIYPWLKKISLFYPYFFRKEKKESKQQIYEAKQESILQGFPHLHPLLSWPVMWVCLVKLSPGITGQHKLYFICIIPFFGLCKQCHYSFAIVTSPTPTKKKLRNAVSHQMVAIIWSNQL